MSGIHNGDLYGQNGTASTKHAPKEKRLLEKNPPGIVVGVISAKHGVVWAVSRLRSDKKTGAQRRVPGGKYARELLKGVSLGTVQWGKELSKSEEFIVVRESAGEAGPKPYCLNYVSGGARGRGRLATSQYHFFTATNDAEAWQLACRYMLQVGVNKSNMRQALLFQDEREVKRIYARQEALPS